MFTYLLIFAALALLLCGLFARLTVGICKSSTCLVGKVAIVTGGNDGIGYQVCNDLASRGCKVIIADKDDSTKSRENIIKTTGNPNIVSKHLNLASFKSIRKFVNEICETEERLDILINNAGTGAGFEKLTEDGLNYILQVNYFGPFLLTHLLIGILKKSSSRVVFTSSNFSILWELKYDLLKTQVPVNDFFYKLKMYSISKSATILATDIFSEKLSATNIKINSIHPGWVRTKIFRKSIRLGDLFSYTFGFISPYILLLIGKSDWEGAQTSIHVAVAKDVENISGEYFQDCKVFPKIRCSWDTQFKEKIWTLSEQLTELGEPEKI